jgi:hypothetical protein
MTAVAVVREGPLLMTGSMVRATLDDRKTQTRRVVKLPAGFVPDRLLYRSTVDGAFCLKDSISGRFMQLRCPYGQEGDRLWMRETWAAWATVGARDLWRVRYDADGRYDDRHLPEGSEWTPPKTLRRDRPTNAPSIFMPRFLSRITLELTGVRVERVQEISEADARAEGMGYVLSGEYPCDAANRYAGTSPITSSSGTRSTRSVALDGT